MSAFAPDLIAQQQGASATYYHPDGLGSVRNLTNSSGQIIGDYSYDVFGAVRSSSGTVSNDFRFAGEQLDETGLMYLSAVYYDTTTGRFISQDPTGALKPHVHSENRPTGLPDHWRRTGTADMSHAHTHKSRPSRLVGRSSACSGCRKRLYFG